jgi:hypothetical protein
MRLVEARIKEALVHPDQLARQAALNYFAESFSRDPEVMLFAIQAFEQYGREGAFDFIGKLANLTQTDTSVEWIIRELRVVERSLKGRAIYLGALSRLLCDADPRLVDHRSKEILDAPGFNEELIPAFEDQLQVHTWDAERCWRELEDAARRGAAEYELDEFDFDRADRVALQLARTGGGYADRILDFLSQGVKGFDSDPAAWMRTILVQVAGEMRLGKAIPHLVKLLHNVDAGFGEDCATALVKIGTDAVVEALTGKWSESGWEYALFAGTTLERIHGDATVRKCLELLSREEDWTIKTILAVALAAQFDRDALEPVRAMVKEGTYDDGYTDLRRNLVAASLVMDVAFPELDEWKRDTERKDLGQTKFDPPHPPHAPPKSLAERSGEGDREGSLQSSPAPLVRNPNLVGRNDPCPCGSGKKYKNCCLNKRSPA